ncbi:hypothetical protein [Fluviispira multicolorata]|uniref:Uncharacterized protein n=1 Tax=Fluviispira multicolorata TaxID=2654512 RepID=A0A833JAQ3_9BACT|nr:hypothetical protein [Fluviispira multicolorata]KAB8028101.1 hypothetical protein GCL57_13705 [Fluviispira multicolorata]
MKFTKYSKSTSFIFFLVLIDGCSLNIFSNDDSVPKGYEKFNFSPLYNPTELIRDSLDKSISSLNEIKPVFNQKTQTLDQHIDYFIIDNNSFKEILLEQSFTDFISQLPTFPDQDILKSAKKQIVSSFIMNAIPENLFDQNYQMDDLFLFKKYGSKTSEDKTAKVKIINSDLNDISINDNLAVKISTRIYYSRNLYESIIFPIIDDTISQSKSTWEFTLQCAQAQITNAKGIQYLVKPWPRIVILQTNSTSNLTDKYILIKNSLIKNSVDEFIFTPSTSFLQNTKRQFILNENGFPPSSTINNTLYAFNIPNSYGHNYSYFQDGMSSFFSHLSSLITDQDHAYNSYSSWQTLINKSYVEVSRKLNPDHSIPDYNKILSVHYLNKENNPVDISYSQDFQTGGIHYIDVKNVNKILLSYSKEKDAKYLGISENFLTNTCNSLMK